MPLYKFDETNRYLHKVNRNEFANEAELHLLIERNLETLLGIQLIAHEYPIPNGRIDSLGLDEDGLPVIIEYKWKKDSGAIIQGLFYLDWVDQNKRPFESIVKDKLGKNVTVTWSKQPRLIIIAQDFDKKELAAINQMGPSIELIKYSLYEGLFNIDGINIIESRSSKSSEKNANEQTKDVTIEKLAKRGTDDIEKLFFEIRERILALNDSVWEKVFPTYVDYRTLSTFVTVHVQKQQLKFFIKMGDLPLDDPQNITKSVPKNWGYGNLNKQFAISKLNEADYAMHLISQAHVFVTG